MSANLQEQDLTPPPLEEGYWRALLAEGEFAEPVQPHESFQPPADNLHKAASTGSTTTLEQDWEAIRQIMEQDETVTLNVVGYNRGGLLVEWRSLRGFVPASQLLSFPASTATQVRQEELAERIGQSLTLRVIELNPQQNRLILSERAASVEAGERAHILNSLQPGDCVQGSVTNLCDFGAFVDLGGLEGLIHISELSWGRVGHPADLLKRGQLIDVHVLNVDRDQARIALSVKRLHPDPWATVTERYHIGQVIHGTITNVVDFGAFACIEEGLEGLIHVSELAEGHFLHPRNVVSEGQQIDAVILSIDSDARRLGLSLRMLH